ncbi:LysR family transcriptional regulator [Bacillus thuringiensis]|uniref:LysR family transcriptional regulator n=1 Tax=Bacillus thuringiensis TaxID=1428 RepID=UPI000CFA7064|nr:LysR family transcriptional regulator [Bacillus thuringiensis]PQQ52210.1 LysR family transcriptional regulator [Bacillus thuringiensis]
MELRQLEYFITLCKELHFTRAADKLGITQPTLSHQIKALEDEIGMPLFDRLGKKIAITDVGYILAKECNTIFNALHNAKERIGELKEIKGGKISIATLPGELTDLVSTLLLDFHKNYPEVAVKVISSDEILPLINENQVNFAVTIVSSDYVFEDDKIVKIPLYIEELFLVAANNHPLANEKEIQFSELNKLPLILFPESHECRKLLNYTCVPQQISLDPLIETSSINSLFDLVRNEFGLTIVSKTLLDLNEESDLLAIPIVNPNISREVSLILRKDKFIGFGTRNFIELLTREIIKLGFPMSEQSKKQIRALTNE